MVAYEVSDGQALLATESLCRSIATTTGFSSDTKPSLSEVHRFRDQAYYKIAAALVDAGYSPTQTDTTVLGFLQNLQVIEMVVFVELSRPIITSGVANERFSAFLAERERLYTLVMSGMLADLGAGATSVGSETGFTTATGVSISRKQGVTDDSDYVAPRFRRGQFGYPGSDPGAGRLSAESVG
jgi:hypothetical protein